MASGWLVLGDSQFLAGYSLLLADPVVATINDLTEANRSRFLLDMVKIGDALLRVTDAERINYQILGNLINALHVHLHPRYASEPDENRAAPPSSYGPVRLSVPFDEARDSALMRKLFEHLEEEDLISNPGPALATDA